ncbi:MAG: sphingomyelin phosphodiesterase [Bacteroidetes bacterium]|nr:sphingomyelin phosphodiesterase [Bacteroidota bacterium]
MKIKYLILSFLISTTSFSNAQINTNYQESLDVLSWNLYMLPGITNLSREVEKSNKKARAREIADFLNNSHYDIVVFQEAFFPASRHILAKSLKVKFPYQIGPANPSGISLKTSSGVFVVSNIPLIELESVVYKACNGADCFAKKGAILLEGEFQNQSFQILGTHLNAGGPHWIRVSQYQQIRKLLDDFKKLNVPQIVCGDMNTHKEDEASYEEMLRELDVEDIPTVSKQVFTTAKDKSVIDYIFLRPNRSLMKARNKEVLWIKAKMQVIERLNGNLSDHLALSASFYWAK